ncbi:uncharacterized protein FPRN_05003 [Fusarium proliferatum]|nr:uncharacterized protein FPRN_05003 [Fusarium proliferatum]
MKIKSNEDELVIAYNAKMRAIMSPLSLILTTSNSLFTSKNNEAGTHVINAIPNSATPNSPPCISSGDRGQSSASPSTSSSRSQTPGSRDPTALMEITRRFSRSCSKAEIASVGISPATSAVFAIYTAAQTSQSWIDVFDIKTQSGYSKTSGSRAVFSPNGSKLATIRDWTVQFTGGFDFHHSSTVFLRDYVSGKTACELKEAKGEPIAWSRDGRLIAVGEARNRIGVWDVKHGVRVGKVLSHIDAVTHAAFLPDQSLVTISRDGTLRITNTKTCKTIRRLEIDGSNNPRALAVSLDGRRIVSVWGTSVHIWIPSANDLTSYNLNAVRPSEGWPLAISPDCRYMLCRTEDGFDIMDVATGTIVYDEVTEEMVMSGAFDEDAKVLVLGRMDGVVEVRDVFDRR